MRCPPKRAVHDAPRLRWHYSRWHPLSLRLDDAALLSGTWTAQDLQAEIASLRIPAGVAYLSCSVPCEWDAGILQATGFVRGGETREITFAVARPVAGATTGLAFRWVRPGDRADWRAWYQAHWDSYLRTHPVNIPRDPGPSGHVEMFGGDDLIAGLFVFRNGRLCGFSSLREGGEIGWLDTLRPNDPPPLRAIFSETLQHAVGLGWDTAMLEIDEDHPSLWTLATGLPAADVRRYVMWRKTIRG